MKTRKIYYKVILRDTRQSVVVDQPNIIVKYLPLASARKEAVNGVRSFLLSLHLELFSVMQSIA
jgi:hypothetical protein